MFIRDIYKNSIKPVKSIEVFPPKQEFDVAKLFDTIEDLKNIEPGFVSVTYGAGGGTRSKTVKIASTIKNKIDIEAVAHFTCVNSNQDDIKRILEELKQNKIENILALRGDPPKGQENYTEAVGGFKYASELIEFIRKQGDWSIAVAGYPEGHPDCKDLEKDVEYLKQKVDAGADVIITQLFFDNSYFYNFRDMAVKKGINIPIVPGLFPILNFKAIQKISFLCGAKLPGDLYDKLDESKESNEDVEKIGIEHAISQALDLLDNDIPGLHIYSMNKSQQVKQIINNLNGKI